MSFFEEAQEIRRKYLAEKAAGRKSDYEITTRVIREYFKTLKHDAYRDMREKALKVYEENGEVTGVGYFFRTQLSWSVTSCDTERIEDHMKNSVRAAFLKLCDELNARKHLQTYTEGVSIYRHEVRGGYQITTRHYDYCGDSDEYNQPYQFEVSLGSRFTPPLR